MIEIKDVTKKFDDTTVLKEVSFSVPEGSVCGLIGANGAGKSTLLRLLAGVYKADGGQILIDGMPVYENPKAKERITYVSDELYFPAGTNLNRMAKTYKSFYKNFSFERFLKLTNHFNLDITAPVSTFSKGVKRQGAIALALSTMPKYLLLDETFDGLDPVMRKVVKGIFIEEVLERQATVIITSHSLRELEDTCDQLSLIHKGGIVFQKDVEELKTDMFKVQIGFDHPIEKEIFEEFAPLQYAQHGSVATLILKGNKEERLKRLKNLEPVLIEALPLTLEEVFIHETSALGYDFDGGDQ